MYSPRSKYELHQERVNRMVQTRSKLSPIMVEKRPIIRAARSIQKKEFTKFINQKYKELNHKQIGIECIIKSLPT